MPTLAQLKENTLPIELVRGELKITCQCYVERISWSNPDYTRLQNADDALTEERRSVLANYAVEREALNLSRAAYDDPEWLSRQLQKSDEPAPKPRRKAKEEETPDEMPLEVFARRAERTEQDLKAIAEKAKSVNAETETKLVELNKRRFANLCERAALLLSSWDLFEDEEAKQMVPTTADSLATVFGQMQDVLAQLVGLLEGAVFGPLVTPSDSTN